MRPPYGGNCTMKITWNEQGAGDQSKRASEPQTFVWEFQP
jgi:type IV pilus assembly protein PilV